MYSIFTIIFAISLLTHKIESDSTVVPEFIYAEQFSPVVFLEQWIVALSCQGCGGKRGGFGCVEGMNTTLPTYPAHVWSVHRDLVALCRPEVLLARMLGNPEWKTGSWHHDTEEKWVNQTR